MINIKDITQVIVSDYSAKYYPFFGLYTGNNAYRDRFDFLCNYYFYTEDEALLQEAPTKLFSEQRANFLAENADCIYSEHDAIAKFGKVYTDPMQYAVYEVESDSVILFSPKGDLDKFSQFKAKSSEEFSSWIEYSEAQYKSPSTEFVEKRLSMTAFRYSRMYRNYSAQFEEHIKSRAMQ